MLSGKQNAIPFLDYGTLVTKIGWLVILWYCTKKQKKLLHSWLDFYKTPPTHGHWPSKSSVFYSNSKELVKERMKRNRQYPQHFIHELFFSSIVGEVLRLALGFCFLWRDPELQIPVCNIINIRRLFCLFLVKREFPYLGFLSNLQLLVEITSLNNGS